MLPLRTPSLTMLIPLLAACLLAVACSDPNPSPTADGDADADAEVRSDEAAATPQPDFYHLGTNFAHIHRRGRGYGSESAAVALDGLADLGFNCIAITPFAYQKTHDSPTLAGFTGRPGDAGFFRGTDPSLTDDDFTRQIQQAHDRGLRVMVKPHIWSGDFHQGDQWHGTITQNTPEDHAQWWNAYRGYILHYAQLAADAQADGFCVGTELVLVTRDHPDQWRTLIRDVRNIFPGHVTYAAHWETEWEAVPFWNDLDSIGVSAYFPLDAPPGAGVDDLVTAWQPWIRRVTAVQRAFDKPVIFLEVGYRNVDDAHREPWLYRGGQLDPDQQARAYDALFTAWAPHPWWRGAYLWKSFTDPAASDHNRGGGDGSGFTFLDNPTAAVLRRWFQRLAPP